MKAKMLAALILVLFIGLFSTGCSEDYLELTHPNRVGEEAMKTPDGVRQLDIGMYRVLADHYNYFWQLYMSHLPGEYEMKETTGEGPMHQQVWNLSVSPSNVFNGWLFADYYVILGQANRVITFLEEGAGTVNELPEPEKELILGGAYFMRAFSHFYLLHSWGRPFDDDDKWGIVMHTSIVESSEQYVKERSKPSEVYAQIIDDLELAEQLLPTSAEMVQEELGRPTSGAATAFLGKVYLFMQNYDAAVEKFEKFISENPDKELLPYYGDNFHGEFENGAESVFEVQFGDLVTTNRWQGGGTGSHYQIYVGGHGMGRNNFGIPEAIMDGFHNDTQFIAGFVNGQDIHRDIRFSETAYSAGPTRNYIFNGDTISIRDTLFFLDNPTRVSLNLKHKYTPKKYISNRRTASNAGGMATDVGDENQVIMRVAEVYLLYAEALAQTDVSEASDWLNKVIRRARGYRVDESSPYDFTGTDKDQFMQLLMEEKRKEFIGEQIRWYDVIRWDKIYPEWNVAENEIARVPGRVVWNDAAACFPIPNRELANNTLLEQNPL